MKRKWILILVAVVLVFIGFYSASADGKFEDCDYLNDCTTFTTNFTIKNYEEGILVEGEIPNADLSPSGDPLEIIITTGDVYTRCSNDNGIKEITGTILYRENVSTGNFSEYIPLSEGSYDITVYLGQTVCANCPQAWVKTITIKSTPTPTPTFTPTLTQTPTDVPTPTITQTPVPTDEPTPTPTATLTQEPCTVTYYEMIGETYPCYLERNLQTDDPYSLPFRFNGTDYMQEECNKLFTCDDGWTTGEFIWTGKVNYVCELPCLDCSE